jgi:energy-coupling factor transport system permease protein
MAKRNRKGLLKLDARTLLLLLVVANIVLFALPSIQTELWVMGFSIALAFLSGLYGSTIKLVLAYAALLGLDLVCSMYFHHGFAQMVSTGACFMRKVFPCAVLGGILIMTIQVSEFMATLSRIKTPQRILVPLTVMLRYLPAIAEDHRMITRAMRMRGIQPGVLNVIRHPLRTVECIYVPLLMSASRRADELSIAAMTRGIESPRPRTSIHEIRFRHADACVLLLCVSGLAALVWSS